MSMSPNEKPINATSPEPESTVVAAPTVARKYLVCVLYYGPTDREHERCVQALRRSPLVADVLELTGCSYIDIGRSICATKVLDTPELGGLLFIDHDMIFEVPEAEKVIESAEACQGTAGAAYSMRFPGRIIGAIDGSALGPDKKVVFFDGGESLPAQYLGMGMTAIHRSVFERLVQASELRYAAQGAHLQELRGLLTTLSGYSETPEQQCYADRAVVLVEALATELRWKDLPRLSTGLSGAACVPFFSLLQLPTPTEPDAEGPRREGNYYGEDVSFCVRCHEHQLPIRVDTRARVYHKGSYCYGIEDVGMQVPYCDRLEVIDKKDPKMAPALFSPDPQVRDALRAAFPSGSLPSEPSALPSVDPLSLSAPSPDAPSEASP